MLHTPVTSAPNALAICTAKVPTPPDAPMTSTRWPGCTRAVVADGLQGGEAGDRDGGGLLEGEVRRLGRELVRAGAGVLGEGALADAEHLVARPRTVVTSAPTASTRPASSRPRTAVLRRAQPEAGEADRVGQAGHEVPGAPVDAGRVHPHQHLVVADRRAGRSRSSRSTSASPYASWTIARIVAPASPWPARPACPDRSSCAVSLLSAYGVRLTLTT